jgi:hypothetical protein
MMDKNEQIVGNQEEETRALREAMSFVVGKKLPIPKNWVAEELDKLEFPNDLSRLTTAQLGELMGIWSSVMAYCQYEVARTDIERTAKWNKYEFEKKKMYLRLLDEGGMTEEQRKAEIYVAVAQLRADFEVAKAKYVMTNALLSAYSKYYQALSRELSRRGLDGSETPPAEQDDDAYDIEEEKMRSKARLTKEWLDDDEIEDMKGDEVDG